MPVPPPRHLLGESLVSPIEGRKFASPATCFRVLRVPPAVFSKDAPEPVELTMFPKQVLSAQERRRKVPDPHGKPFH